MKIYIATAFGNAKEARGAANALEWLGHTITSRWISAAGIGDAAATEDALATAHKQNYEDLGSADLLLVMRASDSGETLVEFAHALWNMKIPIVWIGTPVLSALVNKDRVRFATNRAQVLTMVESLASLP